MKNPFKRLFAKTAKTEDPNFHCVKCGHTWPKEQTQVSGWPDHPYGKHVHCPKCGAVITQQL